MVKLTFTPEMQDVLKSLIGSTFISYLAEDKSRSYGNMRIYTDAGCVEFTNFTEPRSFLYEDADDVAVFKCEKVEPNSKFSPGVLTEFKMFQVGKRITGIDIVSEYNRNVENGFENLFDYGVIIRMGEESFMLVTGCWFSEGISICDHDNYEQARPIKRQIENLCQEDEGSVEVKRSQRIL